MKCTDHPSLEAIRASGLSPERLAQLRHRIDSWVDQGLSQAIVYLVTRHGVVVAEEAVGRSSYRRGSGPAGLDSVFSIASMTKPITATAVLMLVEDGLLSLNRPLVEYIPEARGKGVERVFVHHLLTHTSGFHAEDVDRMLAEAPRDIPPARCPPGQHPELQKILDVCFRLEPADPPGTISNYCGTNYVLLGEIVRRLTASALGDFARERIFLPLGMTSTRYGLDAALSDRRIEPDPAIYRGFPGLDPNDPARLEVPSPSNGVYSTARDLAAFGQMFLDGGKAGKSSVLSPASVRAMTTNQVSGVGARAHGRQVPEANWGFGWMLQGADNFNRWIYSRGTLPSVGTFYHEGSSGAGMWVDPPNGIVGIYLSVLHALDPVTGEHLWEFDRFQNMVTAAVRD